MGNYRDKTTGEVKSQGEWRAAHPNVSMPKVWNESTLEALNLDPVLETAMPTEGVGAYQNAIKNGVEQNSDGDWVEAWQIVNMFSDDSDLGTKAEQEAAYQTVLDTNAAEENRAKRNSLLTETDFYALSDVTMSSEMTTYRKALRDLPTHSNWPHLSDSDWPTKP